MASDISYTTGDTETGANITDIGTRWHRTAQYLVADVMEAETGITAEAAVHKGYMVQTPTPPQPHQDGEETWGGGRLVTKEVGWCRRTMD